jgi:alpha-tubulin suppressor-like RCC1 family protein
MLADLLLVDGAGSGLDADMLDGYHASSFLQQLPISYVTKSGHNSIGMVIGGKLYTTHGSTANYSAATSGRALNGVDGQVGLENLRIVAFPENTPIQKVGGFVHSFAYALLTNGNLYTWGQNQNGQCGLGHTNPVATPILAATGVSDVFDHPSNSVFDVGFNRLFIKKTDGYIYGAGYNNGGSLGLGDTTNRSVFTKITSLGTNVTSFWNLGSSWGCCIAQKSDQTIWASGYNTNGQLGTANTTNQLAFIDVTAAWGGGTGKLLKKVVIGNGYYDGTTPNDSSCLGMLLDDGTITVFRMSGNNTWGSIGIGSISATSYSTPQTPNVGTGRIADIAAFGGGQATVNVLKSDGTLYVFGHNSEGELGVGSTSNTGAPAVATTGVLELLSDGINSHTSGYYVQAAIRKVDGVYICGINDGGYCGLGNSISPITTFTKVLLPSDFTLKYLGSFCTNGNGRVFVAVSTDNMAYAWGYNGNLGLLDSAYSNNVFTPININLPRG